MTRKGLNFVLIISALALASGISSCFGEGPGLVMFAILMLGIGITATLRRGGEDANSK